MINLKKFIVKAKKNTYASNKSSKKKQLKDGSKELIFRENNLFYRDRYFGYNPFVGEEMIFENEKPIWSMNYYGKCIDNNILTKKIYDFLKDVLKEIKMENPYRGPRKFQNKKFCYKNNINGNTEYFYGEEKIYCKKKLVYELKYHGGIIK